MNKELEFIIDTVKGAASLITDEFEVKAKDDKGDLITNFDLEVEQYIIDKIKENYPGFSIISEEFNTKAELTDNCFTIDPIDGTINFANGLPLWAIQVACIKDGKTCAAVIYLPRINELYYADDTGAFLNGKPIHVNNKDIKNGLYCVEGPGNLIGIYKMKQINYRGSRDMYCAAVNFAFVAAGRLSAVSFIYDTYWDYIPGTYIVEKAGGYIYNAPYLHVAANSEEFLNALVERTPVKDDEELTIVKKWFLGQVQKTRFREFRTCPKKHFQN